MSEHPFNTFVEITYPYFQNIMFYILYNVVSYFKGTCWSINGLKFWNFVVLIRKMILGLDLSAEDNICMKSI